jgi:hypothetical protein
MPRPEIENRDEVEVANGRSTKRPSTLNDYNFGNTIFQAIYVDINCLIIKSNEFFKYLFLLVLCTSFRGQESMLYE